MNRKEDSARRAWTSDAKSILIALAEDHRVPDDVLSSGISCCHVSDREVRSKHRGLSGNMRRQSPGAVERVRGAS